MKAANAAKQKQPQFTLPGDAAGDIVDNPAWQHLPADSFLRARLNATHTLLNSENGRRGYTARLVTSIATNGRRGRRG